MLLSDTETMSKNGMEAVKNKYNWEVDSKSLINFIKKYISI
jgi:glycosyltransferase involved in cell wall biosynthesis